MKKTIKRCIGPAFILAVFAVIVSGCRKSNSGHDHAMAAQLFAKSVSTIRLYTDSVKNANDSATLYRLKEGINEKLSKINFQFPADTDLELTEEENDSLIGMIDRFVELVKEKESAIDKTLSSDSISDDSVKTNKMVKPTSKNDSTVNKSLASRNPSN